MKVLFNIAHPAQVHLFRNAISILTRRGHEVRVTAVDKEVSTYLLDAYGIEYIPVGRARGSLLGKAIEMLKIERKLYQLAKKFKPDVLVGGVGNVYVAHVGRLIRKPSIVFDDTEHAKIEHLLMDRFVTTIVTPSCYKKDLGPKQVRYNGYHELAYLHPNYFKPDPSVLDDIGLSKGDTFIVLRFVSWTASHDVGQHGISNKVSFVRELEKHGTVLITSESKLPRELERYRVRIPPERMHDLLYYATLYVGEGGTTASEAAVLGTHAIHISTTAKYCGVFHDIHRYGLLWISESDDHSLQLARELLDKNDLWREGKKKRSRLINSKIDVTNFMVQFIETFLENRNTAEGEGERK